MGVSVLEISIPPLLRDFSRFPLVARGPLQSRVEVSILPFLRSAIRERTHAKLGVVSTSECSSAVRAVKMTHRRAECSGRLVRSVASNDVFRVLLPSGACEADACTSDVCW